MINDNIIKFCPTYLSDTLFLIKYEYVSRIQNLLNNFSPNLRLTLKFFQNEESHFLDLELSPDLIPGY